MAGSGLADLEPDLLFLFIAFFGSGLLDRRLGSSSSRDILLLRSAAFFSCNLLGGDGDGDPLRLFGGDAERLCLLSGEAQSFLAFCGEGEVERLALLLLTGEGLLFFARLPWGLLTGLAAFGATGDSSPDELLGLLCFLDLGGERRDFGGGDGLLLGDMLCCLILDPLFLLGDALFLRGLLSSGLSLLSRGGALFLGGGDGLLRLISGEGLLWRLGGDGLLRRLSGVRLRLLRGGGLGLRLRGESLFRGDGDDGLRRRSNIGGLLRGGVGERRRGGGFLGGVLERDLRRLGGLPGESLRLRLTAKYKWFILVSVTL